MLLEQEQESRVLQVFGLAMLGIGHTERAKQLLHAAQEQSTEPLPQVISAGPLNQRDRYFLAQPKSGAEHIADASRFKRLLTKAESAISEARHDDAGRYLQMAGEIPGFKRHPGLLKLKARR